METHIVYLALGANIGDKEKNIHLALENIDKRIGKLLALSAFYVTEAQGFDSDNLFINAACKIKTELSPLEVLEYTQVIERELGRKKKTIGGQYTDRLIDIDILFYDNQILEYPHLIIPHPHMQERDYVLKPMSDIASDFRHPILNKTIEELTSAYFE